MSFDGSNDYVDAGYINYSSYTGLTIAFWVYLNSAKTGVDEGLIVNADPNTYAGFNIRKFTDDYTYFYHAGAMPYNIIGFNQWKHIVFAINKGSSMSVYFNGSKVAGPTSINSYSLDSGNHTRFGLWSAAYFNGLIDDVRIYNRALSAAEIAAIYNATK